MKHIFGVDIGSYSIKVARVDLNTKGYELASLREYILNQDPNSDRHLQTIEVLREVAASYDADDCRFVFALSQSECLVRLRRFPFRERQKILKSLPFELEDDIPLDKADSIFDARILKYVDGGAEVLACVSPKQNIASLIQLANECNMDPEILAVEGLAFANSVEDWLALPPTEGSASEVARSEPKSEMKAGSDGEASAEATGPIAVGGAVKVHLHLGHQKTILAMFSNNRLLTMRQILWGGRQIAAAIAKRYQMPFSEAVQVLHSKGFILLFSEGRTRDEIIFSDTIAEVVGELASEVRLNLIELKSEFQCEVTEILLSGGVSQTPNLAPFLTQKLEVSTNLYNHFSRYPQLLRESSGSVAFTSNVALGLAFEGMRKPRSPAVNLRQGELGRSIRSAQMLWEKWGFTAQLAGTAFVLLCIYAMVRDTVAESLVGLADKNLRDQAKIVAQLSGPKASESAIRRYVTDREKEIKAREAMKQIHNFISPMEYVKRLSELAPNKNQVQVNIKQINLQREWLMVQGSVASPAQLDLLRRAWSSIAEDGKVGQGPAAAPGGPSAGTAFSFRLKVSRWKEGGA